MASRSRHYVKGAGCHHWHHWHCLDKCAQPLALVRWCIQLGKGFYGELQDLGKGARRPSLSRANSCSIPHSLVDLPAFPPITPLYFIGDKTLPDTIAVHDDLNVLEHTDGLP